MWKTVAIGVVVAIVFCCGVWYLVKHNHPTTPQPGPLIATSTLPEPAPRSTTTTYTNQPLGYAVTYPIDLVRQEYPDGSIALGRASSSHFVVLENVRPVMTHASGTYANFQDFVLDDARKQCAADGPTASVRCVSAAATMPFISTAGAVGVTFSLDRVTATYTGAHEVATTAHDTFGPFYAFERSPDSLADTYAALVVQPSPSLSAGMVDATLTKAIAESFVLSTVSPGP